MNAYCYPPRLICGLLLFCITFFSSGTNIDVLADAASEAPYTVLVFENGANLNVVSGVKVVLHNRQQYADPKALGKYLQEQTGLLPLATKYKNFDVESVEARDKYGIPVSGLNISASSSQIFLLPVASGLHWMWYSFPGKSRLQLPDMRVNGDQAGASGAPQVELECLSSSPKVFHIHNLLTDSECDELIKIGEDAGLERSGVGYGNEDDDDEYSNVRTSETVFDDGEPLAIKLKQRISQLIRMPYGESGGAYDGLQILRYNVSTAYDLHEDYFTEEDNEDMNFNVSKGGTNRYLTVMLYLNDVESGGQTLFPRSPNRSDTVGAPSRSTPMPELSNGTWEYNLTRQCEDPSKLSVKPVKGGALLFYSLDQYTQLDPASIHAGCPVLSGKKYASNLWVWSRDNGFSESRCTEKEMFDFEFVNKLEPQRQLAVYSYTKTDCKGCEDSTRTYLGRLHEDGYISLEACPNDIFVVVAVPTDNEDDDDDFLDKIREAHLVYSTEWRLPLSVTDRSIKSKEIVIHGYNNRVSINKLKKRFKWVHHWQEHRRGSDEIEFEVGNEGNDYDDDEDEDEDEDEHDDGDDNDEEDEHDDGDDNDEEDDGEDDNDHDDEDDNDHDDDDDNDHEGNKPKRTLLSSRD